MFNPKSIANVFLTFGFEEQVSIEPMKLLKLVYIAHGWHLGIFKNPLINEYAEAWKYGPVVPSIYEGVKKFGKLPVTELATDVRISNGQVVRQPFSINKAADTESFLRQVWDLYKKYSGVDLSMMTHQPGTPWFITWHYQGGKDIHGKDIDNGLIKQHYEQLFQRRNSSAANGASSSTASGTSSD